MAAAAAAPAGVAGGDVFQVIPAGWTITGICTALADFEEALDALRRP